MSYLLDSITTFQHLPLTTASVCPIRGPLPRHHNHPLSRSSLAGSTYRTTIQNFLP